MELKTPTGTARQPGHTLDDQCDLLIAVYRLLLAVRRRRLQEQAK